MRKIYEYSHLGGSEILQVRYPLIYQEVNDVIRSIKCNKTKISREKTKKGKSLVSPIDLNQQFKTEFGQRGFVEIREKYTIAIDPNKDRTSQAYKIEVQGAFKQIDFSKERVLIEVQLGKYAFMFYDMAKFQFFFNSDRMDVGVEMVPCHRLHEEMSRRVSYGEQLVFDIERLKRHFPSVPTAITLIGCEEVF